MFGGKNEKMSKVKIESYGLSEKAKNWIRQNAEAIVKECDRKYAHSPYIEEKAQFILRELERDEKR